MHIIEKDIWKRDNSVQKYKGYIYPFISLCADIDITNLYNFAKENQLSQYSAMIHQVVKSANEIENFGYRLINGEPYKCDKLNPVFTYLPKGKEEFFLVKSEYEDDIISFCNNTKKTVQFGIDNNSKKIKNDTNDEEILYISCLPWIKFNYLIRTVECSEDYIPRISWGKFEENNHGRIIMPLAVQVHHGLMDGYHVGMFYEKIQENINKF